MWICLFTCLSVRVVHFELVRGLTAQQFLDCVRRFVARRGRPQLIISDNALQFILVHIVLDREWSMVFGDEDVFKQSLRKSMGKKTLCWYKLLTMLA